MQPFLDEAELTADTLLTKENYEDIVKVFTIHWDIVTAVSYTHLL